MREILRKLTDRELETLNIIQKKGSITKKDLQVITGMKLTTLNRVMKTLTDKKLIIEVGASESTGGRKPKKYDILQMGIYLIGIDISRTYVKLITTNLKLTILKEKQFYMNESLSPEKTVGKIVDLIEQMLSELSINKREVLGIGIGTIGPLDREKGIVLNPRGFFNKNWINVQLKTMIEFKTSITCFLDNGANTAVLAEYLFGKGKGLKNIVYIHCGIGIRSAVITDGIIIRTMNDSEDVFAHMVVDANGEKCTCGNLGCVESYASIESVTKRYISKVKEFNKENIKEEIKVVDYKNILELAAKNNEIATEIINKSAYILGIGLSNLVRILNPQLVILCGPLIENYSPYYDMCIDVFNKNNCLNNQVIFSKGGVFKGDSIAIGSALMVVQHYLGNTEMKNND